MKPNSVTFYRQSAPVPARRGFSLIEVLVVTGLLSVIMIGLVLMFGQTQRAYKLGTTQVDVLEGGRMVTEMLTREISQVVPTRQDRFYEVINFAARLPNNPPLVQQMPPTVGSSRTNLLMDCFFLTKENQAWTGVGYVVLDPATGVAPLGGVGTLYRYSTNAFYNQNLAQLYNAFLVTPVTNLSRILDGVVHFKVRTFDANGYWIDRTRSTNIVNFNENYWQGEPDRLFFYSNAVPASVEIELAILEERTAERARSISDANARRNFLAQQAGKVHVFRWRVPVRNADRTAYP